ncbi:MAG: ABC transporter ATP-binding protein [Planctomycetaceae bacterium]
MNNLVELHNIYKDYGSFRALDDVSMTIRPGVTGLLGPNGAGKSTLIKVLLGLVRLTSGKGTVMGHELGIDIMDIRSKVGYMPEDDCYLHGLSGVESVQLAARLSRMEATEALRRAHEILDFCGAGQERYRPAHTYSTGMRQKLRFAQAIVHDPPLLILDEPTSGLDPDEREAMLSRIRVLASRSGKAILLCTHILPDVQQVSDDVIIMARGKVKVAASLESLSVPRDPAQFVDYVGDGTPLMRAMEKRGFTVKPLEGRAAFSIPGDGKESLPQLWEAARENSASIRSIQPARNSIEEIFLEAIREGGHANS